MSLELDGARATPIEGNSLDVAALPLDEALGMLIDRDDRMHLEFELAGAPTSPLFSVVRMLSDGARGALERALATTFERAGMNAGGAGAGYGALIRFPPGDAALDDPAIARLDELAILLTERPRLVLRACGYAADLDLGAQSETEADLIALAAAREDSVHNFLHAQHRVARERLLECGTRADEAEALPVAELFLQSLGLSD